MERPESKPDVWNQVSDAYVQFVEPFLGQFSDFAIGYLLAWTDAEHPTLIDVACGPGTTTVRAEEHFEKIDAIDFASQMVEKCKSRTSSMPSVSVHHGDGQNLPFSDDQYDAGISMFGLIFFPNRLAGLSELARVVKRGGTVAIGAWAPFDQSELISALFSALLPSFPELAELAPQDPGMSDIETMKSELKTVLTDIEIEEIDYPMSAPTPEDLWQAIKTSFAGLVLFLDTIPEERLAIEEPKIIAYFRKEFGDGPISLQSKAYIGFGEVP